MIALGTGELSLLKVLRPEVRACKSTFEVPTESLGSLISGIHELTPGAFPYRTSKVCAWRKHLPIRPRAECKGKAPAIDGYDSKETLNGTVSVRFLRDAFSQ
jgi:hypothetical protein